jgi:hypothetical protein
LGSSGSKLGFLERLKERNGMVGRRLAVVSIGEAGKEEAGKEEAGMEEAGRMEVGRQAGMVEAL